MATTAEDAARASDASDGATDEVAPVPMDPFARHRAFAGWVRTGKLRSTFQWFLDSWKEPIDTRVDKILDLAGFGKAPHAFLKMPRDKRNDELPDGLEEQLKTCERQFILRNLMRFVKTVNRDDPLEFERKTIALGKPDLDARAHLQDLHRKAELLDGLGVDHMRSELAWRYRFLEVMQWEQYYCKEIRDEFKGPLWKHDPVTNPVPKEESRAFATPAEPGAGQPE